MALAARRLRSTLAQPQIEDGLDWVLRVRGAYSPMDWALRCVRGGCLAAFGAAMLCVAPSAHAAETLVAVAANFRDACAEIGRAFGEATSHRAVFSFGPTGQLYAQIAQGAPYDVFLAADRARVERALAEGLAVEGSRQTYASGRLVLFSMDTSLVTGPETLTAAGFERLAVAEPEIAPYGSAAIQVLRALAVHDRIRDRLVRGQSVTQAYQFVHSSNADLGLVALSQVVSHQKGSRWLVPEHLHEPILQDAVLLRRGAANAAAKAFLEFLRSPQADAVRTRFGYGLAR
ncbi:MAG: molybdate ABC transporter substrate-binding protein [Bryobacterales bacterium]|nr:molybdate ABC transporter substrate-binding protein [Bryobacterales bacterium]